MLSLIPPRWPSARPEILGLILFFCVGFADGVMIPFFPLWAHNEAGIAIAFIGLLFGCYAGGELIATPFIGGIADRIGRRPVLIASSVGVGLGFIALFFAQGVVAAAAILLCIGICESVLHPTISAMIADATPSEDHRRQFSRAFASSSAGRVFGPAIGAVLVWFSLGSVFLVGGAVLLLAGLLMLAGLPETRGSGGAGDDDDDESEAGLSALLPVFQDGALATLLFWFMLIEVSASWIEAVLPLYAHETGALTPSGVELLFTYGAALVALAQMPVSRLTARGSALWLALGAGGALTLAFALLITAPALVAMIAAVTLFAVAQMLIGPLVPTAVNKLAPPRCRATYMAATSVASDLRDSVGPATGTALYAASAQLPWMIAIPLVFMGAVGLGKAIMYQQRAQRLRSGGKKTEREIESPAKPPAKVEMVRICGFR